MTLLEPAHAPTGEPGAARAVLAAASAGRQLNADETEALLGATGAEFDELLALAGALRDTGLRNVGRPGIITYSRKVFVPLTTLCRDRCHYCVFVDTPGQLLKKNKPVFMSPEQVLAVVRQGHALGCKEVLLTLGDRPEERWPEARAWLDEHGYGSTLDYVGDIARRITAETGLLAHLNPGVMTHEELVALRPTAPSMGMMLETTSRRLFEEPGQVHYGSPDKDPDVRLKVIDDAGRASIPFTTGILVGIGETLRDRAESLVALRDAHARGGHVQEVIVQNFRAKPRTAMAGAPDAELREYLAAVATARVVMGADMRIQVPPNLSDVAEFEMLVRAGIDDWGGVSPLTADHVNPERPWPHIDELAERTRALGFELKERLTAHPEYIHDADRWIDPQLAPAVHALADPTSGLAGASVRVDDDARVAVPARSGATRLPSTARQLAERAAADPLSLDDNEWVSLLHSSGGDLDALAQTANDVRRYTVGEAVSLVVNRNLTSSGLKARASEDESTFTLDDVAAIASDAWELGATEICVQGLIPDDVDASAYLAIARAIKAATPHMHLHAYRPQDVADFATRSGLELVDALAALREAGVDTMPGTGVKVLNERVREQIAPSDLSIDRWVETITTAHRAGFRSTSVLFYGHVETAAERISHLRMLREIQNSTGGFTEFVPIPLPGGDVHLVPSREPLDEHRAMVAVSRLLLSGSISHIQVPWTRHGRDTSAALLGAGGDDLGGSLLDGRVRPGAGIEHGQELPVADAARIAQHLFRPFRQRTTDYREPAAGRKIMLQ
ncbi:FO synthase [Microbacterium endophyticum]|uniref:7,8-didemethyl-8-hydroxy-5-deazariboflavin synthase n=1 Tax=Microbacterium endophyticum TaxID=1526412 RepID=A0A7W4YLT4_9MICO|nr:7,8-didemethyl-8-hydroxy-5-deazariboflavin synthase CofG [Microbacterium endophyticum]MBB2975760.1 FO synthase [Microbacterium endophyticum]NIK36243.1 FO synthase [Microbacterium endophyticum]